MAPEIETQTDDRYAALDELASSITGESFRKWYGNRIFTRNIREGKHYFNKPPTVQPSERHSPSQLLQCHRRDYYSHFNAPEENPAPRGIFWTGSQFETEIALPYLRDIVKEDLYVRNSLWIDYTVGREDVTLRIKGETDPVIVDADSVPVLPTEIKTQKSVDNLAEPDPRHRAQIHAYMEGLSRKWDKDVRSALLLYADRTTFDLKRFRVDFDDEFWTQTVLTWAEAATEYRSTDKLPPDEPMYSWECSYCPFRERCGKGDTGFSDIGVRGLLPGYSGYNRQKLRTYLTAHDRTRLTPEMAVKYPNLAVEFPVHPWNCQVCGSNYDVEEIDAKSSSEPVCPSCAGDGVLSELRVRSIEEESEEHNS